MSCGATGDPGIFGILPSCPPIQTPSETVSAILSILGLKLMLIEKAHIPYFIQKFHPQLNPIERVWAQLKRFTKVHCKYSFPSLRKNIPLVYDSVTVENIRHHFLKVRHYMFCYLRHHFRKVRHYMFCYLSVLLQERNLIRHC